MASDNPYKSPTQSPPDMKMHPSNPFFNPGAHERQEPSPGPTSLPPSEDRSTNPFRRAKRTPIPTGHEETDYPNADLTTSHTDNDCGSPDLPTTSGPDPDPDPEIPNLAATAGTSPSTPMPDSPQENSAAQDGSGSTSPTPRTPAAGNIPVDIRAQRAGRRGLNLHVHWGDQDAAASSSSTPAPPQNEQPGEQATPEQPQNPPAGTPPNPPNQPPTTPSAPEPGSNQPNNAMFIIQQPHVAYQASVPMIMTNPPYVMPRQTLPHWGPWCYPKQCPSPFWAGNAHHFTNRPIFVQSPIGQTMPTGPIFTTGPQHTYVIYH